MQNTSSAEVKVRPTADRAPDALMSVSADLYPANRYRSAPGYFSYKRFASLSEAVQYAMEVMPEAWVSGSILETDERRIEGSEIPGLYANPSYPFERTKRRAA
jgi:hypothetical protein